MAKVQRVLFCVNYYESGAVKYASGQHYPVTEETSTRISAGDAELVDIEMDKQEAAVESATAETQLAEERAASTDAEQEVATRTGKK